MKKEDEGLKWICIAMCLVVITLILISGCEINTDKIKEDLWDDPIDYFSGKVADSILEKYNLTEEDIAKINGGATNE